MAYGILLVGIIVSSILTDKKFRRGNKTIIGNNYYVIFWGIVLILMCGLRGIDVGRDTKMYKIIFDNAVRLNSFKSFLSGYHYYEVGFYFLNYIFAQVGNYQLFLVVMSVVSIAPVIYVIYKYSENKCLSFILFICFPYFTFCMSGMRQAGAIGIVCLAYDAMKEKKLIRYIMLCILAMSFHTSAILFFPMYWIDKIPFSKTTRTISVVLMVSAYLFRGPLWQFISQYARQTYTSNDAGGFMMYIFMILTVVLGFYYRKGFIDNPEEDEGNKVLFYMQVLSVVLWPIASVNAALFRMYYYYHLFLILYVPVLLKSIQGKRRRIEKAIISCGYVFVSFSFIITQVLPASQAFNPYSFFWQ